jgi:shikimate kinase
MELSPTVILIGPICAGKSTVGALLAARLGIPTYSVDDHRWDYYREIGYQDEVASRIAREEGIPGVLRYWKPFEAHAVERVLATQSNCVIDFGAGHSVYEEPALFMRVQAALAPQPHVVLLLPSPDIDQSIAVLNTRFVDLLLRETGSIDPALLAINEALVRHPSNRMLAKTVVHTEGRSPEAVADAIIAWMQASSIP